MRLASQLTGWDIDILTEQEESERRHAEFESRTKIFVEALNLDEVVGQLLASEGFGSIEELALVDEKEIAGIEGFDEETARELQERAKEYLDKLEAELDAKRVELGVADELKEVPGVTTKMLVALGENGVKTVEDLAGCATDDLTGWTERKDGESKHEPGYLRRPRRLARGRRSHDHAGPRQGRLGDGSRARAAARAGSRGGAGRRGGNRKRKEQDSKHAGDRARQAKLDRGATRIAPGMQRHCALTRTLKPVDEMIRFVVGPGGDAVPDIKRKLPGRGIWITGTRAALDEAVKRNVFARGFKRRCGSPPIWRRRPSSCWSAARSMRWRSPAKPGQVIAGFAKVEAAIGRDDSWR